MTTKTAQELVYRALFDLGRLADNEVPSTQTFNTVDGFVDPLIEQLSADGIVGISDRDEIPLQYFLPLARLLANVSAPAFGGKTDDQLMARDQTILRRLSTSRPSYEILETTFF